MTAPTSNTEPLAAQAPGEASVFSQLTEILAKVDPKELEAALKNSLSPPGARKYQARYMSEHRRAP